MRVALVLEQFDPRRGGLEQWTARFAARMLEIGHEIHVVARRFAPETQAMPIVRQLLEGADSRLAFAKAAEAKLLALAPDIIHDMGLGWYCDVFHPHGGSWGSVTERKLLLHPRWIRPLKRRVDRLLPRHREYQLLLSRQYADNGQILVALSRTVADDFRQFHKVPPERIRIVYNGVDTAQFSPDHRSLYRGPLRRRLGLDDQTVLALIVAHNFRLKGVPTLLRAMRRLTAERKPVHLVAIGGKRLSGWRRAARRLGVDRNVTFVGAVDETAEYYAAADFYVHPTFYDTCSLVVLEAAASGLPIITSRISGVSELLQDQVEGLLLTNPADADELTGKMQLLLDEPRRLDMGRAARKMAQRHTLDRNVHQILDVYGEALQSRQVTAGRQKLAGGQSSTVGRRSASAAARSAVRCMPLLRRS